MSTSDDKAAKKRAKKALAKAEKSVRAAHDAVRDSSKKLRKKARKLAEQTDKLKAKQEKAARRLAAAQGAQSIGATSSTSIDLTPPLPHAEVPEATADVTDAAPDSDPEHVPDLTPPLPHSSTGTSL